MKKLLAVCAAAICLSTTVSSQTLFTYGTKTVSKDEFLRAFNKNPDTTGSRDEKVKEYLDLYVNFKLKIQAARDEKLDQDQTYKAEAENFKNQLAENYINDQANIEGLVKEAFDRSQKDILLGQIFVETKPGSDTAVAFQQIKQAYSDLTGGKDFGEVAAAYSTDENVRRSKGTVGYITVFVLPYDIENIVYGLPPGGYSTIYHSSIGYHIFKNIAERPAAGKRRIQQILLPTPAGFSEQERAAKKALADTIYRQLMAGASFEQMIQQYGSTHASYEPGNEIEVGIGEYDPAFENTVFALKNVGDISEPFATGYGYNIIRLAGIEPVNKDENDVISRAHLQEKVEQDHRLSAAKDHLLGKWLQQTKYTPAHYNSADLWAFTDTVVRKGKNLSTFKGLSKQTVLFSFAREKVTVADWFGFYLQAVQSGAPYAHRDYPSIMQEFIKTSCGNYYRSHIEDFYPALATQLKEFNEANLLFAVMDRHVWSKASDDTVGLKNYYLQHKDRYIWQPGVSALVVSSGSKQVIDSIAAQLPKAADNWRDLISRYTNTAVADSSRFENGQLPVKQPVPMQKGFISQPELNEAGDAYTVVYVFEVHHDKQPRSFDDARGLVINDYQQQLEQQWLAGLKKKYPVKVNDAVVKNL